MRTYREMLADSAGKGFIRSVQWLLASQTPSEESVGSVLYHAQECRRVLSRESYQYVSETLDALEALGKLPRKATARIMNVVHL